MMRLTTEQNNLRTRLGELQAEDDWLGVVALEHEAQKLVRALRDTNPGLAGKINSVLGNGFHATGDYSRARELHEKHRGICEELGDRAGVAAACGNLGNCYYNTGDYARARELYEQHRGFCEEMGDRAGVATACGHLGICYFSTGDYARACEMHEQAREVSEALGDRAGLARACANIGNCYFTTGDYARACELHEKDRAICEELGDRAGVAGAYGNLGLCYFSKGEYARARELHEKHRAIAEVVGDRVGVARACGNLGNCYLSTGDYARAYELHEKRRAMAGELGDRAGMAMALGNLGNCSQFTGDHSRAREMHELSKTICEEMGDSHGVAGACGNIGKCYLNMGNYGQAISYFTQQYNMAKEMHVVKDQAAAALGVGVAHRLKATANLQGHDASASELPRHSASASACSDEKMHEAEKWLKTALDLGRTAARFHLAHTAFHDGQEDTALQYLQAYLSACVESARNQCAGCNQTRGEDAQMLTCAGCRVARFCSVEHQKMASKSVALGGNLLMGRHRDVCGVLGKWRQHVVKERASPEVLRAYLLAFLRT